METQIDVTLLVQVKSWGYPGINVCLVHVGTWMEPRMEPETLGRVRRSRLSKPRETMCHFFIFSIYDSRKYTCCLIDHCIMFHWYTSVIVFTNTFILTIHLCAAFYTMSSAHCTTHCVNAAHVPKITQGQTGKTSPINGRH